MDVATSQSLLVDVLHQLPPGWWWKFHQIEESDEGLAKVFHVSRHIIDVFPFSAEIGKSNGNGFTMPKKPWDAFKISNAFTKSMELEVETIGRIQYVAHGEPHYQTPSLQNKTKPRRIGRTQLSDKLINKVKVSTDQYNKMTAEAARLEEALLKKIKDDEAKSLKNINMTKPKVSSVLPKKAN